MLTTLLLVPGFVSSVMALTALRHLQFKNGVYTKKEVLRIRVESERKMAVWCKYKLAGFFALS